MTPERMEHLKELRKIRNAARDIFVAARDDWLSKASDFNYALLEELDYYHHITQKKPPPEWLSELKGGPLTQEKATKKKIDDMVEQMLTKVKEEDDGSSGERLW